MSFSAMMTTRSTVSCVASPCSSRAAAVAAPRRAAAGASPSRIVSVVARAADNGAVEEDPDAAFEARLATLKKAKGQMPYGESRKDGGGGASSSSPKPSASASSPSSPARKNLPVRTDADYLGEELFFESGPHPGDATVNVALGITLLWLPLTIAALGRAAFVRYRFTDRRLSVISNAPWKQEQLDADYRDVKQVLTVGRGVGLWGDMVVTLNNGDKVELRSVPRFQEMKAHILARRDALVGPTKAA